LAYGTSPETSGHRWLLLCRFLPLLPKMSPARYPADIGCPPCPPPSRGYRRASVHPLLYGPLSAPAQACKAFHTYVPHPIRPPLPHLLVRSSSIIQLCR